MEGGPIRTCAGCRRRRRAAELIRVARDPDGIASVDPRLAEGEAGRGGDGRRLPGRGGYLCANESCLQGAVSSGRLSRALRLVGPVPDEVVAELARRIADAPRARGKR